MYIYNIYILSDILSGIYSDILSDILSGILFGIYSDAKKKTSVFQNNIVTVN